MTQGRRGDNSPSTMWRSVWHTPHASTLSRTSLLAGTGIARSSSCRGLLSTGAGVLRTAARMLIPPSGLMIRGDKQRRSLRVLNSSDYIGRVPRWPLPFEEDALLTLRSRGEHAWMEELRALTSGVL